MRDPNPTKMSGPSIRNAAQVFGKANETSGEHRMPPSDYTSPAGSFNKKNDAELMRGFSSHDASEIAEKLHAIDYKGFGPKASVVTNDLD